MTYAWQVIETWIQDNLPTLLETLNPGATVQDLIQLETLLERQLPEDFKTFLSVHNGQSWTHLKLFNGDRLLSTDEIFQEWAGWNENLPLINEDFQSQDFGPIKSDPDKGVKDTWWNSSWIPITSNGSGDSYCIDLDPTSDGTYGQIIRMWHDVPWRELEAKSFHEWIDTYIHNLKIGEYVPSDDIGWGGIVRKE